MPSWYCTVCAVAMQAWTALKISLHVVLLLGHNLWHHLGASCSVSRSGSGRHPCGNGKASAASKLLWVSYLPESISRGYYLSWGRLVLPALLLGLVSGTTQCPLRDRSLGAMFGIWGGCLFSFFSSSYRARVGTGTHRPVQLGTGC